MSDLTVTSVLILRNVGSDKFSLGHDAVKLGVQYGPACVTVETQWADGTITAVSYPWRDIKSVDVSASMPPTLPPPTRGTMQVPA